MIVVKWHVCACVFDRGTRCSRVPWCRSVLCQASIVLVMQVTRRASCDFDFLPPRGRVGLELTSANAGESF